MLVFEEVEKRHSTGVEYSSSLFPIVVTKARTCRAPEPVVASGVHQLVRVSIGNTSAGYNDTECACS